MFGLNIDKNINLFSFLFLLLLLPFSFVNSYVDLNRIIEKMQVPTVHAQGNDRGPLFGMNMRGYYTAMPQERDFKFNIPENYYEDSFKIISEAGIKFLRYLFFWESYERDPFSFMSELETVADTADKWGIQVLYANDQYDTSSWLGPKTATGFPSSLFENDPAYPFGTGGGIGPKDETAKKWWSDWLNRTVKDGKGNDGWTLQADYLKEIVYAVDDHKSTLGYEILNEPHIHYVSQWEKIGKYNTFMTDELRTETQKTIFFDRQVPSDLDGALQVNPENMAKMAPANRNNVIFKATVFGLPYDSSYAEARLHYYAKTAQLAGVPLCICEFNLRSYDEYEIGADKNVTMTQENMNLIINKIIELKVWGLAAWVWNIKEHSNANYDFVDFNGDEMSFTDNLEYLKNAVLDSTKGSKQVRDTISPAIFISPPKILPDKASLHFQGYSFDVGSGIKSVEVHTNDGEYIPVTPLREEDLYKWEATLPLDVDESKRLVGLAIDNAGNKEYRTLSLNIQN
jgi:hypothetical protein